MKRILVLFLILSLIVPVSIGNADSLYKPNIVSESAILMDTRSGAILYDKNAYEQMAPASLTKIATAIYAIEKGNLDEKLVVPKEALEVEGTRVYLEEGELVTLEHLVQGMLVNSGNDAAAAIAIHLDGTVENFSLYINEYLRNVVGVYQTQLTNPHGLYDENHYTTAHDLAVITNYAMNNDTFKKIFGTRELLWDGQSWDTTLITHHLLLKGDYPYEGITGGKTGFVTEAKQTLATTAQNDNIQLTAIVLKANFKREIYQDTQVLLNFGFDNYKTDTIPKSSVYHIDDKAFTVEKDYLVTTPIIGYKEVVIPQGKLEIIDPRTEMPIQTITLKEQKAEHVIKTNIDKNVSQFDSDKNVLSQNTIFVILFFVLTTLILGIKKWYRRLSQH